MKPRLQLKQTVKVKVSVRTRLMYAARGITIAAIIAGIVVFLYSNLGTSEKAQSSVSSDSSGTELLGNAGIGQKLNGDSLAPAAAEPTSSDGVSAIRNEHVVTVSAGVSADQITIDLCDEINSNTGVIFTIANGSGTDLDVAGTMQANAAIGR